MTGAGSEMRRAARALVERRPGSVPSDYPVEESVRRLEGWSRSDAAAMKVAVDVSASSVSVRREGESDPMFLASWREHEDGLRLEGEFLPARSAVSVLKFFSVALALIVALAAWAFLTQPETSTRVSIGLLAAVSVFLFPYVVVALSSQWAARQAALLRAFERALRREDQ